MSKIQGVSDVKCQEEKLSREGRRTESASGGEWLQFKMGRSEQIFREGNIRVNLKEERE